MHDALVALGPELNDLLGVCASRVRILPADGGAAGTEADEAEAADESVVCATPVDTACTVPGNDLQWVAPDTVDPEPDSRCGCGFDGLCSIQTDGYMVCTQTSCVSCQSDAVEDAVEDVAAQSYVYAAATTEVDVGSMCIFLNCTSCFDFDLPAIWLSFA